MQSMSPSVATVIAGALERDDLNLPLQLVAKHSSPVQGTNLCPSEQPGNFCKFVVVFIGIGLPCAVFVVEEKVISKYKVHYLNCSTFFLHLK